MAVDKAEYCIIQSELDHYSTFPSVAKHILHNIVLAGISHKAAIVLLDEDNEKDLTLSNELYFDVLFAEVAMYQANFFLFLAAALLASECNDVVAFIVWKHSLEVKVLRLTCVVPCDSQDLKLHLAKDQLAHDVLVIRGTLSLA